MSITIQTPEGAYIIPSEKYLQFIAWLNQHAIKTVQQIREIQQPQPQSILLNE
jgi:hypothetical protein